MVAWNPNDTLFLTNIIITIVCGFAIGFERELWKKSAGITTHIYVMAGAMAFTMISMAMEPSQPGRIAANIVTGIGFLCAGMIFKEHGEKVANLTTAANIWYSAALGMAIGFGWYIIAIIGTIVAVLVPQLHRFSKNK
jgi:putative Mg2+ transporter-C (MgtC) family protein